MSDRNAFEIDALERAASALERMVPTTTNWTISSMPYAQVTMTTNYVPHLSSIAAHLAKMLRDVADEYRPEKEGQKVAVVCQHCWDLVSVALLLLGEEEPLLDHWLRGDKLHEEDPDD